MSRAVGRKLAEAGQAQALEHAVEMNGDAWRIAAFAFLDGYARQGVEFRMEQVRAFAEEYGLPPPPDARAWGAIASGAVRRGLIERVRYEPCENVKAHCALVTVWRGKGVAQVKTGTGA